MSDKTDEKTETTFGIDISEATKEYNEAVANAERIYRNAYDSTREKLNAARHAVTELLDGTNGAYEIISLITTMSRPQRDKATADAADAQGRLIDAAVAKRDVAVNQDPFVTYLLGPGKNRYSRSDIQPVLDACPLTFSALRELADRQEWCTDFESCARQATEAGALPEEFRTVTREVRWSQVPSTPSPKAGEKWVANVKLPAYVRDTTRYGGPLSISDLGDFISSIDYEKVADAPEPKVEEPKQDAPF